MAHVAISRDFIARVESKITIMRNAEIKVLGSEPNLTLHPDSPVVLNAVWGEHIHLKPQMPAKWKNSSQSLRLLFNTTTVQTRVASDGTPEEVPVSCTFNVHSPNNLNFDMPPNDYWHGTHVVHPDDMNNPDIRPAIEYGNAKAEIEHRWLQIRDKVVKFFQSCKSMKEAVTLWPECMMYIDSDDIRRFETKVVKAASQDSEAAKVLAGINKDELVGAAVAARFTGVA